MSDLLNLTRRHFLEKAALGLGGLALSSFDLGAGSKSLSEIKTHFAPRAKRVIYLCQSGGPSQLEMFDYKPALQKYHTQELPDSVRKGKRVTDFTAKASKPMTKSFVDFKQYGQSGTWISDLLPHISGIVDDICVVKSMHTDAINHDPAITYIQTGSQIPGRPSLGAWLSYGLGSMNENLPHYVRTCA